MAKVLWQSTRIHVYGGGDCEKRAYALVGYDGTYNDSCITLIRGEELDIPRLLNRFGHFTAEDIKKIRNLHFRDSYWPDNWSQVIRIA